MQGSNVERNVMWNDLKRNFIFCRMPVRPDRYVVARKKYFAVLNNISITATKLPLLTKSRSVAVFLLMQSESVRAHKHCNIGHTDLPHEYAASIKK